MKKRTRPREPRQRRVRRAPTFTAPLPKTTIRSGVVLLAAGSGNRMGGKKPKQFLLLDGEPLFLSSLRAFLKRPSVREVVVVCRREDRSFVKRWVNRLSSRRSISTADGGTYRGE